MTSQTSSRPIFAYAATIAALVVLIAALAIAALVLVGAEPQTSAASATPPRSN